MEKIKRIEHLHKYMQIFLTSISVLTILWVAFKGYSNLEIQIKQTEQMSMQGIIWNKDIPLVERIRVCDAYIHLGFNSYTKRHCESLLKGETE